MIHSAASSAARRIADEVLGLVVDAVRPIAEERLATAY